jgi:hypothetical protein
MYGRLLRLAAVLGGIAAASYACGDDSTAPSDAGAGDGSVGDGGPGAGDGSEGDGSGCGKGTTACGADCADLQTSAKNCGACGHDCLGGACTAGKCEAKSVFNAHGTDAAGSAVGSLAVDGTSIYWVTPRVTSPGQQLQPVDCAIYKCPLGSDCASPTTLITEHEIDQLLYLSSTVGVLYYSDVPNGSIRRLGVGGVDAGASVGPCSAGGSPCAFTGAPSTNVMTSDGVNLYWGTNYNNTGGVGVFKAAVSAPSTAHLGPASGTSSVVGVAIDLDEATHLWTYTVDYQGNVYAYRTDQTDQTPQTIASSQGHPGGIVVAGHKLFWSNPAAGKIAVQDACTSSGCKPAPATAATFATFAGSEALTADTTNLYWTAGGRILACPLAGCADGHPQELAFLPSPLHVIMNDANAIYTGDEQGAVWRLAK